MTCKLEGYPYPTVAWYKDGRPLPASNRLITNYNLSTGVVTLKITDVQLGDSGNYTCFAQNKVGQDQTFGVLQVNQMPGVDNTSMVKPDAFRYLEAPRGDHARTRPADDRERANYKPPRFVIPLNDLKINESQPAHLAAKVEGFPKPKITWFKDSRPLPASTRYTTDFDLNTGVVSLRISDVQMNDVGVYTALAENEAGQDRTSCNTFIKQMPNIDTTPMVNPDAFRYLEHPNQATSARRPDQDEKLVPPKVIIPLSNVKLEEGQSVLLACKIEGHPRPKLTWFKDSVVLPAANRYTTDYDLSTNVVTLKIDNAQMNDLGTYIVLAENEAGRDQTFCSLFVQQMPGIDQRPLVNPEAFKYLDNPPNRKSGPSKDEEELLQPPVVIVPLQDLQLKEGEPVLLVCRIEGNPKPKVRIVFFIYAYLVKSSPYAPNFFLFGHAHKYCFPIDSSPKNALEFL